VTTVCKLGGSVITEKDRAETLDGAAVDRAADAVAEAHRDGDDLILVHGGGSFGHHHAETHGVSTTAGSHEWEAVADIHGAMTTLNRLLLSRLHERDVPAVPVHPLSAASRDADAALSLPTRQVERLVGEGFVPVLHGDVVAHEGEGVTVLSGDEIVAELAELPDVDRLGLCSTVPGVLHDDEVIPEIRAFDEVADVVGASDATDVSGGMAGKVRSLLSAPVPASVFGLDDLGRFLDGERPGTTVYGGD
jgi:isopentenyl phosphate kinase